MNSKPNQDQKIIWSGSLLADQPRIRLTLSFDQRYHTYLGYLLSVSGLCDNENGDFLVAVGKGAHLKHQFQVGMELSGFSVPVDDERLGVAGLYKTTRIRIEEEPSDILRKEPPYLGVAPDLLMYRERGHRRLDIKTYRTICITCIWGCNMPVEIIVDQWDSSKREYRFESFCYGPKSCLFYRAGPTRKVPGRSGIVWEEEDWIDKDATAHRGPDE